MSNERFSSNEPFPDLVLHLQNKLLYRLNEAIHNKEYGLNSIAGHTVADVGPRDGRYIKVFQQLGAQRIIAIEPDIEPLLQSIIARRISGVDAYAGTVQEIAPRIPETCDTAFILHCSLNIADSAAFMSGVAQLLKSGGQAIFTFSSETSLQTYMKAIQMQFRDVKFGNLMDPFDASLPQLNSDIRPMITLTGGRPRYSYKPADKKAVSIPNYQIVVGKKK